MALGYGLHDRRFKSQKGLEIFLFTTASRPALEPTQLPILPQYAFMAWRSVKAHFTFYSERRPQREREREREKTLQIRLTFQMI
jgi:hypothetical protein